MMGSRRLRFGEAMSILARRVREPSGNSPAFIRANRSRFSSTAAISIGTLLAGLGQGAALLTYFVAREIADVGFPGFDELDRPLIELVKIIGGVEQPVAPISAQPARVFDDGVDVLGFFFGGVGVIEAQIAFAAELGSQSKIQIDGFRVANMQIAVGLRRKTRVYASAKFVGFQIVDDDVADEVGNRRVGIGDLWAGSRNIHVSLTIVQRYAGARPSVAVTEAATARKRHHERGTQRHSSARLLPEQCLRGINALQSGFAA